MGKIISSTFLRRKLTGEKLNSNVGRVCIYENKTAKTLGGAGLKEFITKKFGGKTDAQIGKLLKEKYGVSGYQANKRMALMKLIKGGSKTIGLTKDQKERNLRYGMRRDEITKQESTVSFAGGKVSRIGIGQEARTRGSIKDLNVINNPKNIGFAGGGSSSVSISINQK